VPTIPYSPNQSRNLPRRFLLRGVQYSLLALMVLTSLIDGPSICVGQAPPTESTGEVDLPLLALEKIQVEYAEYLAKRKRIHEEYGRLVETLKQTDEDFQKINNESIRNQLLAMQASLQSSQMSTMLQQLRTQDRVLPNPRANKGVTAIQLGRLQNRMIREKATADLNTAIKGEELRQLDSASQAIVRRRAECIQSGFALEQEWIQWQQQWPKFMELYWPHCDPEQTFTRSEIDARLTILKKSDPEDFAAMIVKALLMERIGEVNRGMKILDEVTNGESSLESTAWFAKALLMHSIDKVKDAKGMHLRGTKTDNKSPVNSWLKGRIAAREKQFSIAESQWKSVLEHQPFEIQAHRELAVLHYARIAKSANESRKCLKEAQTAFDLEPTHNWYSHFVLALALHGANDSPKAREHIEEALRLATEENQVLCQKLSAAIQNNESYEWDFKRKLGAIEN